MPAAPKTARSPKTTAPKAPAMTLEEAMATLEAAGSEQTRKIYRKHGALDPLFGVNYSTLKPLMKRIGVDHALALQLWETGNHDARNLAVKVVDPAQMSSADLDHWALDPKAGMFHSYVAQIITETPLARAKAEAWLGSSADNERTAGWSLVSAMAMNNAEIPDDWFAARLAEIETRIHTAPNAEREAMNHAVISIGCHSADLRVAARDAAVRIGKVAIDHGDTACKTPEAAGYIEKSWTHSLGKGFESPAAHERSREPMRLRC